MQDTIVRKKQKLNLYFLTNNYNQKEYLISEKIVKIGQVENLSLQQLKTVYNLNCKYHEVR